MSSTSTPPRPELSVVVPVFNEEDNIDTLHARLTAVLNAAGTTYEVVFVNDGSTDRTTSLLDALAEKDPHVVVLTLSRNFGHQAAVTAGIDHVRGDAAMVMDADLQDPPEVIPQFVQMWKAGNDVVYAVRERRKEGIVLRACYRGFYRLLNLISDIDIPLDSGDFGLVDRKVIEAMKALPERKRFVRGLRSFVGFRQVGLSYERARRDAGEPKYSWRGLMGLAIDGLVSFSNYPLRIVTYLGLATALMAIVLTVWVMTDALIQQSAPQGWASTIVVVLMMSAVQLISLGIIGEYIRLMFVETKGRPTYIVAREQRAEPEVAPHSPKPATKVRVAVSDSES